MHNWEATPCGKSVSDKRMLPEPSKTRSGISCPCTLSGCHVYARGRVLAGMRGVPMKCFL